jgi:hypothetical protein
MSEQQDILHCPFCGHEAKAYASHYANLGEHWVICLSPNCGGKTHWWASREQAIAAWNMRAGCASCRDEAIGAALAVEQKCYDQAQELAALRKLRDECKEILAYTHTVDGQAFKQLAVTAEALGAALAACDEASAAQADEHTE